MKKILLGAFIVYNVFAMSAYTYAADSLSFNTESIGKEIVTDTKESLDINISEAEKVGVSDSKGEKSKEKNDGGISIAPAPVDSTGCDSTGTPSITVLSPNGGEVFTVGQQVTVKWTSCNIPSNYLWNVMLSNDTASTLYPIAMSTHNDGQETFAVPSQSEWSNPIDPDFSYGPNFKVLVSAFNPPNNWPGYADYSDNFFTVNPPVTTPSITVISPNGGEIYYEGQEVTVTWSTINIPANKPVSLSLINPQINSQGYILHNLNGEMSFLNDGQETIIIPRLSQTIGGGYWPNGRYYKISALVTLTPGPFATTAEDSSDDLITIRLSSTPFCNPDDSTTVPAVEVLAPNGGEHFLPVEMPVNWRTCMIPNTAQMKIDLVMHNPNGTTSVRNLVTTINDGAQVVPLPNTTTWPEMVYGNNFKVRIYPVNSPSYGPLDQSNQNFRIAPASVMVNTDPTTPQAGTVIVNNTASTNNVTLLKFQVKATDSDLTIQKIPVQITSNSGNVSAKINTIKLMKGNTILASTSGTDGYLVSGGVITGTPTTGAITTGYIFTPLNIVVIEGTTESFTVAVDIKALAGNYNEGDTLTALFTSGDTLLTSNFSILDTNGDQLTQAQKSGNALGQTQVLRTHGVNTVMGLPTVSSTLDTNGSVTLLTYNIPLSVTSYGSDHYLGQSAQLATNGSGTNALAYVFNVASNPTASDVASIASSVFSSNDAVIEGNGYKIEDGITKHFTLVVSLITPSTPNSSYRVALQQIRAFTNSLLTTGATNMNLLPPSMYQTNFAFINN